MPEQRYLRLCEGRVIFSKIVFFHKSVVKYTIFYKISCLSQKIIVLMALIAFFSVKVAKNSIIFIILPNRASGVQRAVWVV